MPYDDFQLEERVEQNIQRKRKFLRWAPFAVNLICFTLYTGLVLVSISERVEWFYLGSLFRDVHRGYRPEILWLPMVFWFLALCIQFASVLIESGKLDKSIAARARAEEEEIIQAILGRLAMAEKRKRDSSDLEDNISIVSAHADALSHLEIEEHPRHATL